MSKLSSTNYPNASMPRLCKRAGAQNELPIKTMCLFVDTTSFITSTLFPSMSKIFNVWTDGPDNNLKVTIAAGITSSHSEQRS